MKNILVSTLGISVFIVLGSFATAAQPALNAEKLALIKEFLVVTNAKKMAADSSDMMLGLQASETQKLIDSLIDEDKSLSPEMKADVRRIAEASAEKSNARVREFFSKRMDLGELIEEVSIPVYDKHFTEQQMRDLITFYKTPTGKRMIEVTPQLTMELMTAMMGKMIPKLQEFMKEAAESELKILKEAKPIT